MWTVIGTLGGVLLGGVISWFITRESDERRFDRDDLTRWDTDIRDAAAKMVALISRNRQKVARFQRLSRLRRQSEAQEAEEFSLGKELYDIFVELDLLRAELALVAPDIESTADTVCRRFEETVEGEWLGEGPDGHQMLGQKVAATEIPVMIREFTAEVRSQLRIAHRQ